MEITSLIPHIEALIFASDKPLISLDVTELLNNAFGFMEDKISLDQVEAALEGIQEKYQSEFYPFEVKQSGGGWQFLTKKDYHKTIAQLNGDKFLKRLSAAAMETLSIVAYKQPVTKGEIEAIRGVSSDYAVQKLLEKELIVITGRNETLPGHPLIYSTSKNFMDYFGINTADDLPKIKEVLADQQIEPTSMKDMVQTGEAGNAPDAAEGEEGAELQDIEAGAETEVGVEAGSEVNAADAENEVEATHTDEPADSADEITAEADYDEDADQDDYADQDDDEGQETEAGTEAADSGSEDSDDNSGDDLLSVDEDGQLIGRMEEDDEDQS